MSSARDKLCAPCAGFVVQSVDQDEYWQVWEREMAQHEQLTRYMDAGKLAGEPERSQQKARGRMLADEAYVILRDPSADMRLVAMFNGYARKPATFTMQYSVVHPDFRRRGLYHEMAQRMVAYATELGYSAIVSTHSPDNNAILIAKLSLGFKITGFALDSEWGPEIQMRLHLNEELARAFSFQTGELVYSEALWQSSHGTAERLLEALSAARNSAESVSS